MDAEYKEYQDALAGLKTATDTVNTKRLAVIEAINKKAAEFGAQVASDTSAAVKPTGATGQ